MASDGKEGKLGLEATMPYSEVGPDSSADTPTPPPSVKVRGVPDVIDGRYAVESTLGEGAMGVVYLARERALERLVAIKTIAPEWAHEGAFAARFLAEARAMARIRHPNVVQVFTFGEHDAAYYLAMEFVRGPSLAAILRDHTERDELLSIHNAVAILAAIVDGVAAIHDAGLLHCDLKPANVVVEEDTGRAVIIDFGVATKARTQSAQPLAGSPAYMPPEQFDDGAERLSEQSDIYALGVTAFELLTGRLPYTAGDVRTLGELHSHAPIPRISQLRADLAPFDVVVERALAKRSENRFTSCAELRVALDDAMSSWSQRLRGAADMPMSDPRPNETNVLVVDDDPHFRSAAGRAAKLAFVDQVVRILPASSGEQALAIAARRMPTLILLDYMLPDLDGVATLSAIRSLPGGHDARVIVISGSVDEVRWRFSALGVKDFLAKPVGLDELIETVHAIGSRSGWNTVHPPPSSG